jgi:hypothetical protein
MDINMLLRSLDPIAADPLIDSIIFALPLGMVPRGLGDRLAPDSPMAIMADVFQGLRKGIMDSLVGFHRDHVSRKPIVVVLQASAGGFAPGQQEEIQQELLQAGIPVYLSLERASRAMARLIQYHEFHRALR